jgi:hypothetical protein
MERSILGADAAEPEILFVQGVATQGGLKKRPRRRVWAETTDKGGGDKFAVSHDIGAAQGKTTLIINFNGIECDNKTE